jgi:pimeloyl-ACP methyl ester carboxylesterase
MTKSAGGVRFLTHCKQSLALHELKSGASGSRPLLLLHGLGERAPDRLPSVFADWPGEVHALDFTGHGLSPRPKGGGYTAEILMADADQALAELGPLTVCGRGLGAYVALLLAGGRAREVLGAILCDGPGLAGGGSQPTSPRIIHPDPVAQGTPDPFALAEISSDLRPPDYTMSFFRQAMQLGRLERTVTVCARHRPEWLSAVADASGTEVTSLDEALAYYASVCPMDD